MLEGTTVSLRGAPTAGEAGERRTPLGRHTVAETYGPGRARFLVCVTLLSAVTVLADISVAPGVAGGMIHLAVVLLGWWAIGPKQVIGLAAWATALVCLGFGLRFGDAMLQDGALQIAVVDRIIALLAIAGVAAVIVAAKRRQRAMMRRQVALVRQVETHAIKLAATQTHADLASRGRSEFFARMGHELRTPLNAIIGFSEIIKDEIFGPVGSARYREYMHDINNSGQHLLDLINDLLSIARIEVGKIEIQDAPLELAELAHASIDELSATAQQGGITVEMDIPADLAQLRADGPKLRQILDNLLSNAIKFSPPGGTVRVSAQATPESGYVIQVADEGIGMAVKDLSVALSPFGQVANALRQRHEGSGLGLPLTKALVELHAGTLDLQSEPGVGTTATLRFPSERIAAIPKVA